MSEDETVNGPKIAAQILARMKTSNKEKIVKAIQAKDPDLAVRIEENLFDFEDISEVTPQGVQVLVQAIEHTDLVMSLKTASPKVKAILLENMSERKRKMTVDDFEALPPTRLTDVEEAQRRILRKLDELRTSGAIRTQSKNDVWV